MLLDNELDDFISDPSSFSEELSVREKDYKELFDLIPPFIVNTTCAPLSDWPRRSKQEIDIVNVGEELIGVACSPGVISGTARVILDPNDSISLEPGDILITQNTDPAWTHYSLSLGQL